MKKLATQSLILLVAMTIVASTFAQSPSTATRQRRSGSDNAQPSTDAAKPVLDDKSQDVKASDAKTPDTAKTDTRATDTKAADTKTADVKTTEAKAPDTKTSDTKTDQAK